ncbi:MAG: DUF2147 domain-containing protein [Fibrobacter sp.]|nr:DUF2147 domain-containing protein [Fibrobacter sp.]
MKFHNFYYSYIIVLSLFFCIFAQNDGDRINGKWFTHKCQAAFEFYRVGQEYKAKLIAIEKPNLTDDKNPVDSLRGRKLDGAITIYNLIYDSKTKQWHNGKVYNPEDGRTYSCYCSFTENGDLMFRGYIGVTALGKTQNWTRKSCKSN